MSELDIPQSRDLSQLSFDELMNDAPALHTFDSEDLIDKSHLCGIPFVITEVTFRPTEIPNPDKPKQMLPSDYVSVVGRLANEKWLDKAAAAGRIPDYTDWRAMGVIEPEARIIFNDGSTGVRRQLVKILHDAGYINVGGETDGKGKRDYDRRLQQWDGSVRNEDDEYDAITFENILIRVFKGLHRSRYAYGGGEAETYYLS